MYAGPGRPVPVPRSAYLRKTLPLSSRINLIQETCTSFIEKSLSVVVEEEISVSGGKIRTKKRTGTTKDYPNPDVWSAGFLQYIAVLSRFGKYHGLTYPFNQFPCTNHGFSQSIHMGISPYPRIDLSPGASRHGYNG